MTRENAVVAIYHTHTDAEAAVKEHDNLIHKRDVFARGQIENTSGPR
jgi:hypothetical protein